MFQKKNIPQQQQEPALRNTLSVGFIFMTVIAHTYSVAGKLLFTVLCTLLQGIRPVTVVCKNWDSGYLLSLPCLLYLSCENLSDAIPAVRQFWQLAIFHSN
jgi:hypothetical protein